MVEVRVGGLMCWLGGVLWVPNAKLCRIGRSDKLLREHFPVTFQCNSVTPVQGLPI